jgi:hypothetical protein
MKCHYEKIKGVGKVLIPGCMTVAVSNDIELCTCHSTTYDGFECKRYNNEIKRLKGGLFEVRCDGTPLARRRSLSKAKAFANEIYKQKIRERLGL